MNSRKLLLNKCVLNWIQLYRVGLEKAMAPYSSILAWKIPWMEEPGGLQSMGLLESDTTERLHFHFHFHALEKEMASHSSVLAWRTPGTGEPGGLPFLGSHRVGHDWSDLAAAAAYSWHKTWSFWFSNSFLTSRLHCSALENTKNAGNFYPLPKCFAQIHLISSINLKVYWSPVAYLILRKVLGLFFIEFTV